MAAPPPSSCSVCAREDVGDIDAALDRGDAIAGTARAFNIIRTTLQRHAKHRSGTTPPAAPEAPAAPAEPPTPEGDPALLDLISELAAAPEAPPERGPGRPCACCSSTRRAEVDRRLVAGESAKGIERALGPDGPSDASVLFHARTCIPGLLGARAAELREEIVTTVRGHLSRLLATAQRFLADAEAVGEDGPDHRGRAALINACVRVLEVIGRLLGEIGGDTEIQGYRRREDIILETLLQEPHLAAAAAVRDALRAEEARAGKR